MSYKETLNNFEQTDDMYGSDMRIQEISQDISAALNDDSLFGQLIANSVGEIIAQSIEKSGLDAFVNDGMDGTKSMVASATHEAILGAVQDTINSQEFTVGLAGKMAEKEVERELNDFHKNDKEPEM